MSRFFAFVVLLCSAPVFAASTSGPEAPSSITTIPQQQLGGVVTSLGLSINQAGLTNCEALGYDSQTLKGSSTSVCASFLKINFDSGEILHFNEEDVLVLISSEQPSILIQGADGKRITSARIEVDAEMSLDDKTVKDVYYRMENPSEANSGTVPAPNLNPSWTDVIDFEQH